MATINQISLKNTTGQYDTYDIEAKGTNVDIPLDSNGNVAIGATPVASHSNAAQMIKNNKEAIAGKAAASTVNSHISTKASSSAHGHIKLGDGFTQSGDVTHVAFATNGQSAEKLAVQANDSRLSNKRANPQALKFADGTSYDGATEKTINAASVGALTSGHGSTAASASTLGHVKTSTGLINSSGTISVAYGSAAGTACQGNDSRLSNSRTPVSHATTSTTYGSGTSANYGHTKLTDTYKGVTPNVSTNGANTGIAASAYALQAAYNELNTNINAAKNVSWSNISDKPGTFPPSGHSHDDRYYTESEINSKINTINSNISGKADTVHNYANDREILTNETYLGKPVYRKIVSIGSLPNNGTVTYVSDVGYTSKIWIDHAYSFLNLKAGTCPLPWVDTGGYYIRAIVNSNTKNIEVTDNWNYSQFSAQIALKYIK